MNALLRPPSTSAVSLSFVPPAQSVPIGQSVSVDVVIADLGADEVGDFDFDVSFDPTILTPVDVTFGILLGDPALVEALTSFSFLPGVVDLAEVSLLSPPELEALQPDSFALATLVFNAVGAGSSRLSFPQVILDDAFARPLAIQAENGSVSAVPEPGTLWLLGIGLTWVIAGQWKRR